VPNRLGNIQSIIQLASDADSDDARDLASALLGLEQITKDFRLAVDLFAYSALEIEKAKHKRGPLNSLDPNKNQAWKEQSAVFYGWQHIAARDGAVQIYNVGRMIEMIKGRLKKLPEIRIYVDSDKLGRTVGLFRSCFPNYELIRHASAHSHYEIVMENGSRSHAPEETDIPGVARGRGLFITNTLSGNRYIVTKDKKVAWYEISYATYEKLESVRTRFIAGFDSARIEAIKRPLRLPQHPTGPTWFLLGGQMLGPDQP
jgi:hypothetical protein